MNLTLGFSPCPNDTFIFDALVHGRVDTEGLHFEVVFADIAELNKGAAAATLDITKLSYYTYAHVANTYALLGAGSALGRGCGPLVVRAKPADSIDLASHHTRIAIPGFDTTANFLMCEAYPQLTNKQAVLFSSIEEAVLSGEADLGLIIHENRFTYQEKGLHLVADLGDWWETTTGYAIPLGGIAVRRTLPVAVQQAVQRVVRRSVEYAFAHPAASMPYVRAHSQAMDDAVMQQHIALYVNEYSRDLGEVGTAAVDYMLNRVRASSGLPTMPLDTVLG